MVPNDWSTHELHYKVRSSGDLSTLEPMMEWFNKCVELQTESTEGKGKATNIEASFSERGDTVEIHPGHGTRIIGYLLKPERDSDDRGIPNNYSLIANPPMRPMIYRGDYESDSDYQFRINLSPIEE